MGANGHEAVQLVKDILEKQSQNMAHKYIPCHYRTTICLRDVLLTNGAW